MHDPSTNVRVHHLSNSFRYTMLTKKKSPYSFTRMRAINSQKYLSKVVHTLHCNCNDKTGLGVYQRYYSVLYNTPPFPDKQREALCENCRSVTRCIIGHYAVERNARIMERENEVLEREEREKKKRQNMNVINYSLMKKKKKKKR